MKQQKAFTLIELTIFITIIGVITGGLITAYMQVVRSLPSRLNSPQAVEYAQERTEFIVGHYHLTGQLEDPCDTLPSSAICQVDAGFSVKSSFSPWTTDEISILTVKVTGKQGGAQIKTLMAASL